MRKKIKNNYNKFKKNFDNKLGLLLDEKFAKSVKKTIIINGFWRSGTTMLQNKVSKSVKGKSIFEPFGPDVSNESIYRNSNIIKADFSRNFHNAFMPFSKMDNHSDEFQEFILSCSNGQIKSNVVRRLRETFLTSFNQTVVCKVVRGHLLLPYLLQNYKRQPIIHIKRNPKAVIASITRKGWGYWFNDFYLVNHLINIDDGRAHYFKRYRSLIDKYDKRDSISRICALWWLSEKFIEDNCRDKSNFISVKYEDLINEGYMRIEEFLLIYDHKWIMNNAEEKSSATTNFNRKNLNKQQKRDSWITELDVVTQNKIDLIIQDFNSFS